MPRSDEPRVTVRLGEREGLILETASQAANIAVGALVRECVRRSAAQVAADASAGRLSLRRRSVPVPVPAPAAPERAVVDVVRGGEVVGQATAEFKPSGYPDGETVRLVPKPIEIPKDGAARAAFFRSLGGGS